MFSIIGKPTVIRIPGRLCAEKLRRNENGAFLQAEVTSCGLNDGPLNGKGRYEARIACQPLGEGWYRTL